MLSNSLRLCASACFIKALAKARSSSELICEVSGFMVGGYRSRRPFSPQDLARTQRLYEAQQSGKLTAPGNHHHASQYSMSLVGVPGAGKSFILKKIASMFPPVIFHKELGRWQIPFLFIEMPYEGESRLALASHIFTELDRLLPDSNYYSKYMENSRGNAERLCIHALRVAYEMGVGMIVVDEAQNSRSIGNDLAKARKPSVAAEAKKRESGLKKLLITASNIGDMPLMFTGTMELESTLLERASHSRRKSGRGSATWQPLKQVPATDGKGAAGAGGLLQVDPSLSWVDLILRDRPGIPFPACKHLIIQAAISSTQRPDIPLLNHRSSGYRGKDVREIDVRKSQELDARIKERLAGGRRFTLKEELETLGVWNGYRHNRAKYPAITAVIVRHRAALLRLKNRRDRSPSARETAR